METDKKDSKTHLEFDLGKYPVKAVNIISSTAHYHRQYTLEFKNNSGAGNPEAVLRRFTGTFQPGTRIEFSDIRADKAILTIENNADTPLADLVFQWLVPQEALLLDPTADMQDFLKLYYGGEVDKLPEFDFKHYVEKYNGTEYYKMFLYNDENNSLYKKADRAENDFLKKLLPYIIALAAITTAIIGWCMLKKVQVENNSSC